MFIKKGETEINVPSWLAVLGLIAVTEVAGIVANAVVIKKSK